jgi:outer membrane protein OmpA-like peptidoglycan-associated protein
MSNLIFLCFFLSASSLLVAQNVAVLEHKSDVVITELTKLNSKERECNLSVSPEGNRLYYMSTREFKNYKTHKDYNSEIFYSTQHKNGSWSKPKKAGDDINSDRNEDEPSLSNDGSVMYFQSWTVSWRSDGGPYYEVEFLDGEWKNKKGLGGGINLFFKNESELNFGYATDGMAISSDGNLFIVACGPEYNGNLDLYYSIKENGVWSYPKLFPASTLGNERSVFIAADNKTIYFSSNGYDGFGGMDLFKTTFENGTIGPILNLGKPFNTAQDDMGFVITKNGNSAFLIRDLDIYYADLTQLEEEIKPIQEIIEDKKNEIIIENTTSENKKNEKTIDFMDDDIEPSIYYNKPKQKSFTINFDFDSYGLTEAAKSVLNLILKEVKDKNIKIELVGHTDNIGNNDYNSTLSEKRVNTIENWFKEHGIEALKTAWKGEANPKVPNSNSQNRSENRRVDILISTLK